MKMRRKLAHPRRRFEQAGRDDVRLQRAEADARGRLPDGEQEIGEAFAALS